MSSIAETRCTVSDFLEGVRFMLAAFLPIEYVRARASRITNAVQNDICNEIASIKSKIGTASTVTDAIQNYFMNRKRSLWLWLWLWVEYRSLLNRLGFIFRTNVRKTDNCSDTTSKNSSSNKKKTIVLSH